MGETVQSRIDAVFANLGIEVGFSATHLASGLTIGMNADRLFPTASVFKVPLMVEIYRQAEAGRFALGDRMKMEEARRTMGSGVLQKLEVGIAPTIRDLVMLMTVISDNTATEMLLHLAGPANVTATMHGLGLADIHVPMDLPHLFAHAYGLALDPVPGYAAMLEQTRMLAMDYGSLAFASSPANVTSSAAAMSGLMGLICQNRAASAESCADMLTVLRAQQLRDRVPRYLPTSAVGNKTGTFRGVRNDAGLIWRSATDVISFAVFTFDRTVLPGGNSRALAERNMLVNAAMAEMGEILWTGFGV